MFARHVMLTRVCGVQAEKRTHDDDDEEATEDPAVSHSTKPWKYGVSYSKAC